MKIAMKLLACLTILFSTYTFAVEIVIKTSGEIEKKDEGKTEEVTAEQPKPELPKDAVLKINALNQTNYDIAIQVMAFAKDQKNVGIKLQNVAGKSSLTTLGSLIAKTDSEFLLDMTNTIIVAVEPAATFINCQIVKQTSETKDEEVAKVEPAPTPAEEIKPEETKTEETLTEEKKAEQAPAEPTDPASLIAKKSIDFTFYQTEDSIEPKCAIQFDSLPSI